MARALIIVACGILLGLAITWLVGTQVGGLDQRVQPANANEPYGGARPVQEPAGTPR